MAEKLVFDVLARASGTSDVKRLGDALDGVGKSADNLDKKKSIGGGLFKGLAGEAETAGKSVTSKLGSAFSNLASNAAEAGKKAGSTLASGISSGFEALGPGGPYAGGAIFAGLLAAAPVAGAAIGGALIAGVASAGIGAGIALALQDPEIKGAASVLGGDIVDALTEAAEPFKGALLATFSTVGEGFKASLGDIKATFSNLAPMLEPLAAKTSEAFASITRGVAVLSSTAGPVMTALGNGIAQIGETLGTGFAMLSQNGAAAATGLQMAFSGLNAILQAGFGLVNGLTEAFGWLAQKGLLGEDVKQSYEGFKEQLDATKNSVTGLGSSFDAVTPAQQLAIDQVKLLTGSFAEATNAAGGLKGALDTLNGSAIAGVQSEVAYQAALDGVTNSVKSHGTSLDTATEAGRANTTALTQAITTAQNYASANDLSATQVEALRQSILQQADAAGLDTKTVTGLINELFRVPGDVKSKVSVPGATLSTEQVKALQNALTSLPDEVRTKVITEHLDIFNATGSTNAAAAKDKSLRRWGGIDKMMAAGGVVQAHTVSSPTIMYGERATKEEAYVPKNGITSRSREILDKAAAWYGGRVSWGAQNTGGSPGGGTSGGDQLSLLVRELIGEVRGMRREQGQGNVYLDGRLVGAVQGRELSLYERAG